MSQLADLVDTFVGIANDNNWSLDYTVLKFLDVTDALEWQHLSQSQLNQCALPDGKTDWDKLNQLTIAEVRGYFVGKL